MGFGLPASFESEVHRLPCVFCLEPDCFSSVDWSPEPKSVEFISSLQRTMREARRQ